MRLTMRPWSKDPSAEKLDDSPKAARMEIPTKAKPGNRSSNPTVAIAQAGTTLAALPADVQPQVTTGEVPAASEPQTEAKRPPPELPPRKLPTSGTQKSVLITGCSEGGIGDALARSFFARGFQVFATARNMDRISHLKELGCTVLELDVCDEKSIATAVEQVTAGNRGRGRGLDYLFCNAGMTYSMPLLDTNLATVQKLFSTNLFSIISLVQAFTPLLVEAKGTIVNISSVAAYVPTPWMCTYNASKAALTAMSNSMRYELKPLGVKVVVVSAGGVKTKILDNQPQPTLPQASLYNPSKRRIEKSMRGDSIQKMTIPAEAFAKIVIKKLGKKIPWPKKEIWAGGNVRRIRLVKFTFSGRIWDLVLPRMFGVEEFEKAYGIEEGTKKWRIAW